jgi:hypothetical protein
MMTYIDVIQYQNQEIGTLLLTRIHPLKKLFICPCVCISVEFYAIYSFV